MRIPENMSEDEVLATINKVVGRLSYKFRFAYHSLEDIEQEGRILAIEAMEHYEEGRPLENFLWRVVRNGLVNFKRDNYIRPNEPCEKCKLDCKLTDKKECKLYQNWEKRNKIKKNILCPINLYLVNNEKEHSMRVMDNVEEKIERQELIDIIQRKLPITLREDWLRVLRGLKVAKYKREKLETAILEILNEEKAG
jgi:DNA-directed RNA polymerase specialized sigma24 family protein